MEMYFARVVFDTLEDAALGLIAVIEYARSSTDYYRFGPLTAEQVLASGLEVSGEIQGVLAELSKLQGATVTED